MTESYEEGAIIIDVKLERKEFDEDIKQLKKDLEKLKKELSDLKGGASVSGTGGSSASGGGKKESAEKTAKKTENLNKKFHSGFKSLAKYALGLDLVMKGFHKIIQGAKEAIDMVVLYDAKTNRSISNIKNSMQRLSNQLAAAFAPVINAIAPVITQLLDWLNELTVKLAKFIAALAGQSTFLRATKVQKDYAASLKATMNNLTGLDEINKFQQNGAGSVVPEDIGDIGKAAELVDLIREKFERVREIFGQFAVEWKDFFSTIDFGPIKTALGGLWDSFTSIIDLVIGFLGNFYEKWVRPVVESLFSGVIEGVLPNIVNSIRDLFNFIKAVFTGDGQGIVKYWNQMWKDIWESVKSIWNTIIDMFKQSLLFQVLKDAWEAIKSWFKNSVNNWITMINAVVNAVVNLVNLIINALNKIKINMPDWDILGKMAGKSFGFNITPLTAKQIPYLASGAVIPPNAPFAAILGDQRNGNNLEAPEELLRKIVREESGSKGGNYQFIAQINRRTLFDEMINEAKMRQTITGVSPFMI